MRRRSTWLRCIRSRCPNDPDDGADLLGRHVSAVRRQPQRLAGRGGSGFGGHGSAILARIDRRFPVFGTALAQNLRIVEIIFI